MSGRPTRVRGLIRTTSGRFVAMVVALVLVLAACSSDSTTEGTSAPDTTSSPGETSAPDAPAPTTAPEEPEEPEELEELEEETGAEMEEEDARETFDLEAFRKNIDLQPTEAMANNAREALEARRIKPVSERGV